jgi:hypothetical protein
VDVEYKIQVLQRFNEQDFCYQGIYEPEPELYSISDSARGQSQSHVPEADKSTLI